MLEGNPPARPAGNTLHNACYDNAVNKIYCDNNKCNENQNDVVIEIDKKYSKIVCYP